VGYRLTEVVEESNHMTHPNSPDFQVDAQKGVGEVEASMSLNEF